MLKHCGTQTRHQLCPGGHTIKAVSPWSIYRHYQALAVTGYEIISEYTATHKHIKIFREKTYSYYNNNYYYYTTTFYDSTSCGGNTTEYDDVFFRRGGGGWSRSALLDLGVLMIVQHSPWPVRAWEGEGWSNQQHQPQLKFKCPLRRHGPKRSRACSSSSHR